MLAPPPKPNTSPWVPSALVPKIWTNAHLDAVVLGSTLPLIITLPLLWVAKGILISAAAVVDESLNVHLLVAELNVTETPAPVSLVLSETKPVWASPISTGVEFDVVVSVAFSVVVSLTFSVVTSLVFSVVTSVVVSVETVVSTSPPAFKPPTDTNDEV